MGVNTTLVQGAIKNIEAALDALAGTTGRSESIGYAIVHLTDAGGELYDWIEDNQIETGEKIERGE